MAADTERPGLLAVTGVETGLLDALMPDGVHTCLAPAGPDGDRLDKHLTGVAADYAHGVDVRICYDYSGLKAKHT